MKKSTGKNLNRRKTPLFARSVAAQRLGISLLALDQIETSVDFTSRVPEMTPARRADSEVSMKVTKSVAVIAYTAVTRRTRRGGKGIGA